MTEHRVVDRPEAGRYELLVGDEVAGFAAYDRRQDVLSFTHTVVEPAYEGQGLGSALARGALDDARSQGRSVLPYCPFVRGWIAHHPDYVELVPAERRGGFGLAPDAAAPGTVAG